MQWLMLQQEVPKDHVTASGAQYSECDFINAAGEIGIIITWHGEGFEEEGFDDAANVSCRWILVTFALPKWKHRWGVFKAREKLGCQPEMSFDELVKEMMREDLKGA